MPKTMPNAMPKRTNVPSEPGLSKNDVQLNRRDWTEIDRVLSDIATLPTEPKFNLPNFSEMASSAIGYRPDPNLPRVSDQERRESEQIYREQINAAKCYQDSLTVASEFMRAAINSSKLVQTTVDYHTQLQEVRTRKVKYLESITKTDLALGSLSDQYNLLNFNNQVAERTEQDYALRLQELDHKIEEAKRRNLALLDSIEKKYPTIDTVAKTV